MGSPSCQLGGKLTEIVGYRLAAAESAPFDLLRAHVTGSGGLRRGSPLTLPQRRWYALFVESCLSDVPASYIAACIHREGVQEIEAHARALLGGVDTELTPSTVRLDAHYLAFLGSYRACLDQAATGLAAYFRKSCSSFRSELEGVLESQPGELAAQLCQIVRGTRPGFAFAQEHGPPRSLRHRAARAPGLLPPVTVMAIRGELVLAAGGAAFPHDAGRPLSEVLAERLGSLQAFLIASYAEICRPRPGNSSPAAT